MFTGFTESHIEMWAGQVVDIATDSELDGPGSNNPGGDEIFRPSRPALGPTQPPVQWVPGLSLGCKVRPGRAADHSPPSSDRGHGTVELCLYPPSGPHRACNGITLPYIEIFCLANAKEWSTFHTELCRSPAFCLPEDSIYTFPFFSLLTANTKICNIAPRFAGCPSTRCLKVFVI